MDIFTATCPMLVPISDNEKDDVWDKFRSLPIEKQNILCSEKTASAIKKIIEKFNISLEDGASISAIIKLFFLGYIDEDGIEREIKTRVPALFEYVSFVAEFLKEEIIFSDPREHDDEIQNTLNKKVRSPKLELSLLQAMRTYPNLGEQVITSNSIHLKIFPQPVRPSIKNWIEDYRSVMGAERHGMMERGNYLFHTENTKRLTSGERKKLAEILRSLDEDVTLKVDPDRQEIVFEQAEEMKPVEKMTNYQNNSLSSHNVGGVWDKKENVQNIPRSNFQAPKQQIPNYPQSNPLLKSDDGMRASQNTLNQNFQSSNEAPNANVRFSSPQTFSSEKKPEPVRTPFQQSSNYPSRDLRVNAIPQSDRKIGYTNPRAGKPWEPASTQRNEPKVNGNTVDLRN